MKAFIIILFIYNHYAQGSEEPDCFESGNLSLEEDGTKELKACRGSVIRLTFIPKEKTTTHERLSYTFEIHEGLNYESLLIRVNDEDFSPSEKEILLVSHHYAIKISKNGDVPFTLAYKFVPSQIGKEDKIVFGSGKLKNINLPSHFYQKTISLVNYINDRQKISLKIPGQIWSDPIFEKKILYDPEYVLTTMDTGNGRRGILTANSIYLGLRKISSNTTINFMTGTRSKQILDADLKITGWYDMGERHNLSTILPPSPTPPPPFDSDSIQIYFMSINENDFYNSKFTDFKTKMSKLLKEFSLLESVYNTKCELLYNPPKGFRKCRKDCALSDVSLDKGCGSVSITVKKDIAQCAVYSTESFRNALQEVSNDLSNQFEADIQVDNCLTGTKTSIIASAIPVLVVVVIFVILYTINPIKTILSHRLMKIHSAKKDQIKTQVHQKDFTEIGYDNDSFFEEWNKQESDNHTTKL